jgi:LPS O-antigen subunit length determinant protein (WzzB/FepE family)
MKQSNQEKYPYQKDEIDLRNVAKIFKERRWFIFGFTCIVTFFVIIYTLNVTPTYRTFSSFVSPSQSSVLSLNRFPFTIETSETMFTSYLRKLSQKEFQKKVFYENDFLTVLNPENEPIDDVENYVSGFLSSISLEAPDIKQAKDKKAGNLPERPYSISMEGSDGEIISRFLNELVVSANNETVNDFINITNQKIAFRLDQITRKRGLLVAKAKQLRLNMIEMLTDAAKLAGSLGIIENNLEQISESEKNFNFSFPINEIAAHNSGKTGVARYWDEGSSYGKQDAITAKGTAQHTTNQNKIGSSSIAFDGDGSYLEIPATNELEITGDFTIETWLKKINTSVSNEQYIVSNMGSEDGFYIFLQTNSRIYFGHRESGVEQYKGFNISIDTNWHHFALVRHNQMYKFYWDGELQLISYDNMGNTRNTSKLGVDDSVIRIGSPTASTGDRYWEGNLDEFRISNKARYTSSFIPSRTAFTADANTSLLIHSDTANGSTQFIDDSGITSYRAYENEKLPNLYLYGQKALLERVELLKSRTSDEPYIPELLDLDNDKLKLESSIIDRTGKGINVFQLRQAAVTPINPIKPNTKLIVLLAFICSFILSIFLVLVTDALKPDEKNST